MISRRTFLKDFAAGVGLATCGLVVPGGAGAEESVAAPPEPFALDMQRAGERVLIDLRTAEGQRAAAWLLRDIRGGNVVGIPSPDVLRLLAWAQAYLAAYGTYTVLDAHSGLRLPRTNATTERAVQGSRHLPDRAGRFAAVDVFPLGINKTFFGQLAATPRFGGVGWYDSHIHFDCRPRPVYWRG